MKNFIIYFILMLISTMAIADTIETNLYYSNDTDNTSITKYDTRYNMDNGYGFGIGKNVYDSEGQRVSYDKFIITNKGLYHNIEAEIFDSGEIAGNVNVTIPNNFTHMEFGIEREMIDSNHGINDELFNNVYYYSIDFYSEHYDTGIALVPSYTHFDEGGNRKQLRTKIYKGIGETGVHVYVRSRNYWNSDPYNGIFFSPEEYSQYLAGFGFRRVIGEHTVVSGHVDVGRQYVDGYSEPSHSWKLGIRTTINDNIGIEGSFARDKHTPNYYYALGMITVTYHF